MLDLKLLLHQKGFKATPTRLGVLEALGDADAVLPLAAIERHLPDTTDRITLYRTLISLEERGIIHTVVAPDGAKQYALCNTDECTDGHHHHNHLHFICTACQRLQCLYGAHIPAVHLPKGFTAVDTSVLVSGICDKCSAKKEA